MSVVVNEKRGLFINGEAVGSESGEPLSGAEVMRQAAGSIKHVRLELGGTSPSIVFVDANLEDAVLSSVWSIFSSTGQSCEARSRIFVERAIYEKFVEGLRGCASGLTVGDPLDRRMHMGSLISPRHRDPVHDFVEAERADGAEVVIGGRSPEGEGALHAPTLLADPGHALNVERVDVFGPVATVVPFHDEEDVLRMANDVRYGLMATLWSLDSARGDRMADRLPGVPFGGFKQSGCGREFALETLDQYLETKSVILWANPKFSNLLAS